MKNLLLYDDDIEQSVLASVMAYPDEQHEVLTRLKKRHFSDRNGLTLEVLDQLAAEGLTPALDLIVKRLMESGNLQKAGGATYLSELWDNVPPAMNIGHYMDKLENLALKRELAMFSNAITKRAAELSTTGREDLDKAMQMLIEISSAGTIDRNISIADSILDVYEQVQIAYENPGTIQGIETGLYDFDKATNGLIGGRLYTLAGRPGEGKSALAGTIGHNAAKAGHPVQIFSLEMTHTDFSIRLLSAESKIKLTKLQQGELAGAEWDQLNKSASRFDNTPLFIDDTPGLSTMDLLRRARTYKAQQGIELFIIDYLQLMRGEHPHNKVQDVADISWTLKLIAKDLSVPVLALSQLNRNIEHRTDKAPILSDLRDSGNLEQDADVVLFIHTVDDETWLRIEKNRHGKRGRVRVYFAKDLVHFQNGIY